MQNIFREFVFIVCDRIRIIVLVFLTVFMISAAVAVTLPSVYRSNAKFSLIVPQSMDPLQQENSFDYRNRVRRYLQDQKELILSNRVLGKVALELDTGIRQPVSQKVLDAYRKNIDVSPPAGETFEGSSVFILEYTNSNPVRAMQVASSLTENYLEAYRELSQSKSDYSYSFFLSQTKKLHDDMLKKEDKLREFEKKQALALLEILNLEPGKSNAEVGPNALLNQFLRSYHELQVELAGLNSSIDYLDKEIHKNGIPSVPLEMEGSGRTISVYKTKVAQLQLQLNEMKPQFSANFEPLKQVEQEYHLSIDSLKKELGRSVDAQKMTAKGIEAKIHQLETIINGLKDRIQKTAGEKATYETLKQEYYLARDAYTHTMTQLEQTRMAKSLNEDKQILTLIDKPALPVNPFKPNRMLIIIGGFISGLFLGIAVALTVDHFDHRIKTLYDIETHLNVPVLGFVSNV
jgi:uncharacterized protein involved in exopolysaccharide biosynthesis